jgi:ABC-2 type transport system permease protein
MSKLGATIKKDLLVLTRDKIGLLFMFMLPVLLALLITAVQNSTFELVNDNAIRLGVRNSDKGEYGKALLKELENTSMFRINVIGADETDPELSTAGPLVLLEIPPGYSNSVESKAAQRSAKMLRKLDLHGGDTGPVVPDIPLKIVYHPVLQQSFRSTVKGVISGAAQVLENRELINSVYKTLGVSVKLAESDSMIRSGMPSIKETTAKQDEGTSIPNATQHNIPAWTIFAMFFVVISMGSSLVREKRSGSYLRLKTMEGSIPMLLVSKQITYLIVTFLQALLIFLLGSYLFPLIKLPALAMQGKILWLIAPVLVSGISAVSFAQCIGVFARTHEQANGFGSVAVVVLAAIGGIMVPAFAMPSSFQTVLAISPMHWCLESFYAVFLGYPTAKDIFSPMLPLFIMIVFLQLLSWWGLKHKNLA